MTEMQNNKHTKQTLDIRLLSRMFRSLDFRIWNLFEIYTKKS